MAYLLREFRCSACGHQWEALVSGQTLPRACPRTVTKPHAIGYKIERVVGVPASYKHSSWSKWQR